MPAASSSRRRSLFFRVLRRIVLAVLAILLIPYAIAPFYRFANPVSTLMLWRWATGQRVEHSYVPIGAMARTLPLSVMAAEDARFCEHSGIDWAGLRQAVEEADDDLAEARGGSTITQQVAKNLFLWQSRSFVRKALEAPLALWINLVLPKRRVMEIYLNIAEWGPNGEFGVEAGAQYAFHLPARRLSARQSALMAAILPNPHRRNAGRPGVGVRRLAGIYEARARAVAPNAGCLGLGR
jgi:monofunctional biosynthetic peptidoglycan transglycosylase